MELWGLRAEQAEGGLSGKRPNRGNLRAGVTAEGKNIDGTHRKQPGTGGGGKRIGGNRKAFP